MSSYRRKLSALVVVFVGVVLNPIFFLSGCFLRCPDPLPYVHNYSVLEAELAQALSTPTTPINDEGMLEITLSDPRLRPMYQASMTPRKPTVDHGSSLVQSAYATPSCETHERPPQLSFYYVTAVLSIVWIPSEGESVTLVDGLNVSGNINGELEALGADLTVRGTQFGAEGDKLNWDLRFTRSGHGEPVVYTLESLETSALPSSPNTTQVSADAQSIFSLTL